MRANLESAAFPRNYLGPVTSVLGFKFFLQQSRPNLCLIHQARYKVGGDLWEKNSRWQK
jgi:hypothetical protein